MDIIVEDRKDTWVFKEGVLSIDLNLIRVQMVKPWALVRLVETFLLIRHLVCITSWTVLSLLIFIQVVYDFASGCPSYSTM
jgi:hypothetical protein